MSDVAKVVTIIGSSPESFAKAADAAVQEAAKTLRGITGAQVVSMSAVVENDRISEYRTTVNIAFAVERGGSGGGWERSREVAGIEGPEIVEAFADADQLHG